MGGSARPWVVLGACVLVSLFVAHAPSPGGDPARGRELFARGVDADGTELTGFLAREVPLVGRAVACINCHGAGGRGRAEGGLAAPDLRALREVDAHLLARALEEGIGLDGRRLSPVMPRFRFRGTQRADLLAYLKAPVDEPGVSPHRLRIGALLPLTGPRAELGARARDLLAAAFREVNERGGIFRRELELVVADAAHPGAASRLERETFALVAGEPPPADSDLVAVAPAALPRGEHPRQFFLVPGPADVGRLAVAHLARRDDAPALRLLVSHRDDDSGRAFADGARREAVRRGLSEPSIHVGPFRPDLLATGVDVVLLGGHGEDLDALEAALAGNETTRAIVAGHLIRPVSGPIRFVHPWRLDDAPGPGEAAFASFLARTHLPAGRLALSLHTYAAARLLVEGLRRAGAEPTRAGLAQALSALRDFDTGVTPPVSFGEARRVGIAGAHLARWDRGTGRPVKDGDWVELR